MSNWLTLDFETRSTVDLRKVGVYRYAEDPTTDVWCCSYAFDDGPIRRWALGDDVPADLARHVERGKRLRAWNAQFERTIWRKIMTPRYGWPHPKLAQWTCSAAAGARVSLPRSLEEAAQALGLPVEKDMAGNRLMLQMSKPRRIEDDGTIIWWDDEDRLQRLYAYCDQDVLVEREIWKVLPRDSMWHERQVWLLDQRINDRGVGLDTALASTALKLTKRALKDVNAKLARVTDGGVTTVNQTARMVEWSRTQGLDVESFAKVPIAKMLSDPEIVGAFREMLEIRQDGAKSSTAKFKKMLEWASLDDVLRGMMLYHGAGTGRWAGKGPQPQNFLKGEFGGREEELVADILVGSYDYLKLMYPSPMVALASALRSCFRAREGRTFFSADFNAIEARMVAWLAGATRLVELFRSGGKVYEDMASTIYGIPVDEVAKDSFERFVGKTTVLGCGFQMGPQTFVRQLDEKFNIQISMELGERAVRSYRTSNPEIPRLWKNMNARAIDVVDNGISTWTPVRDCGEKIHFRLYGDWLQMRLPSGRALWYAYPEITLRKAPWRNQDGSVARVKAVSFYGVHPKIKKWVRMTLYGGLLTENAVQGMARDLLVEGMVRVERAGYPCVLTVHDEVVAEPEVGFGSHEEFVRLLTLLPPWAEGCPVAAEGWEGPRYKK